MDLIAFEQPLASGMVIRGLQTEQRGLPLMVFRHGNGFAAGVYMPMLKRLAKNFDLLAIDLPGHGKSDQPEKFPGWNAVAEMSHQAAVESGLLQGRSVIGVGHSLGGALSLLSAHRHPRTYQSLVLLDPVTFPKNLLLMMRVMSWLRLTRFFHPYVKSTLKRRNGWDDRQQAYDYLNGRKIFAGWTDEALRSFIEYGLVESSDGTVRLACDPATEATFFATLPDGLWAALQGISVPTTMIMGDQSYPFSLRATATAERVNPSISRTVVNGGHCFMQEFPQSTAREVLRAVNAMADEPV